MSDSVNAIKMEPDLGVIAHLGDLARNLDADYIEPEDLDIHYNVNST